MESEHILGGQEVNRDGIEVFDDDGYPSEEFLNAIAEANYKEGFETILDRALSAHIYPHYWEKEDRGDHWLYYVSTGGWSGNEDIIAALQRNTMFWMVCWQQSKRGGHFQFRVRKA